MVKLATSAACVLLVFIPVIADEPSYNYFGIEYSRTDLDNEAHYDAFNISFNEDIGLADDFHIFINLSEGKLDGSRATPLHIDSVTYLLGVGRKFHINDKSLIHLNLGYRRTNADVESYWLGSFEETANSTVAQLGIRSMVTDSLEIGASIDTDNLRDEFDIASFSFHIEQKLSKNFGLNLNTSVTEEGGDVSLALGLRFHWGR